MIKNNENLHSCNLFRALTEKAIRLNQESIHSGIRGYRSQFYDEVQLFFTDQQTARSRGDKVPGGVTKIVRGRFVGFPEKEATIMFRHVTRALETALSTMITKTLATAILG